MPRGDPISDVQRSLVERPPSPAPTKVKRAPTPKRSHKKSGRSLSRTYHLTIEVDAVLLQTIREAVQSAKLSEDLHYTNVSDFIRKALIDYKNGMKLTAAPRKRGRGQTSIFFPASLRDFWESLPARLRYEILDRVLRTKLERM